MNTRSTALPMLLGNVRPGKVQFGRIQWGKVLLGKVLLGNVLLGNVLLGNVLLGKVLLGIVLLGPALSACVPRDALQQILNDGELVVVSRFGPTTYFVEQAGPGGFEYALAELLAQELGVRLVMRPAFDVPGVFDSLRRGDAQIAAAGLALTPRRASQYPHSSYYEQVSTVVVYDAGKPTPRDVAQLAGHAIAVLAASGQADQLRELRDKHYPDLVWEEIPAADTAVLLERVRQGTADVALLNSNEFSAQQAHFPQLRAAFAFGGEQQLVWYLTPRADTTRLIERIDATLARWRDDGTLDRLREVHLGHTDSVSRIGSHAFTRRLASELPRYRALMQRVAREFQVDWRLLAAVAYQESHWDPLATSPTGVRGMMMLTSPTARELGVDNRLDPAQSLRGGARYLKNILRRLPPDIAEPDRSWMALAAYNTGMGHLEDARVLTERQGGDPHRWQDVMERLPLLQQPQYFQTTRHGYARGRETVIFVQNIRHYYNILQWQDVSANQAQPPLRIEALLPETITGISFRAL